MRNPKRHVIWLILVLGFSLSCAGQNINDGLLSHWRLSDGSGTVALDSVGQNHGTLMGDATWTEGIIGGAILLDGEGDYVNCGNDASFNISKVTLAAWVLPDGEFAYPDWSGIIMRGAAGADLDTFAFYYNGNTDLLGFKCTGTSTPWHSFAAAALFDNEWHHVAATYDGGTKVVYMDALEVGNAASSGPIIGSNGNVLLGAGRDLSPPTHYAKGKIDDARVYERALSQAEVTLLMQAQDRDPGMAWNPIPADASDDVLATTDLAWTPGDFAVAHTVYFGTSMEDVNTANPGVLVGEALTDNRFDPGHLEFGQTYYWRVDEVNGAPDRTVFAGDVWSFTVEPQAIPVEQLSVTASGASAGMEASNTINGSGLDELGQHNTAPTDMWLTGLDESWIQYEFDRPHKLHALQVWNSNQTIESFIGFGIKEAIIETSIDGTAWTPVPNVEPFAKAPGLPMYTPNTTVDLSGIVARYVKVIPQSAHGTTGQTGLSEVRFLTIPMEAREPNPVDHATVDGLDVLLVWRAGREAAAHDVLFNVDRDVVANGSAAVATVSEASYPADSLAYGQTYYWQIVEVNNVEAPAIYAGPIWSFTISPYGVFEGFETYTGEEGEEVFMSWWDGYGGDSTLGGSTTGHIDGPFVETSVVNGGKQSMPVFFDNDGGFINIDNQTQSPRFSEVQREFSSPQDFAEGGATTLTVAFQGQAGNTGQDPLYITLEDSTGNSVTSVHPDPTAIQMTTWQDWLIPLAQLDSINLGRVKQVTIGVGYRDGSQIGSEGILYIDDLRVGTP
jgi:hypothetical protein